MTLKKIFIPVVGQFTNIGDTLHRKILLSWLKDENIQLCVYVGDAPKSFLDALKLRDTDKVYSSYYKWAFKMCYSALIERIGFIYNPGELTMSTKRLILELGLLPFHLLIKLRKGVVLRVGVAAKSDINIKYKFLWYKILSVSTKIYWRTEKSHELFSNGKIIPDLAFYDTDPLVDFSRKNKLVVSMRGDRRAPNELWYKIIKDFAAKNSLEIIVVSQVRIDNERTLEIAKEIGAQSFIWDRHVSHNDQEHVLNNLYKESVMAISDRLHVLIAAFTKGVIPVNITVSYSNKVQDHFDVVGLAKVTVNPDTVSEDQVHAELNKKVAEGFDMLILERAKNALENVKQEVKKIV